MNLNRFRLERILRISPRHEAGRRHLATAPRADGPCLGSCLISNKLPVVIRGPANYDHDYDHDDDDDKDEDYDGSGEDGQ